MSIANIVESLHSGLVRVNKVVAMVDWEFPITGARLSILATLTYGGPQSIVNLARIEGSRPPTITNLVKGLEKDGFIKRATDKVDGRSFSISVTTKGKSVLEKVRQARLSKLTKIMNNLSDAEVAVLNQASKILLKMSESFE